MNFISTSSWQWRSPPSWDQHTLQGLKRAICFPQVYCCISMITQSPEFCACHTSSEISWVVWHQGSASNKITESKGCSGNKKCLEMLPELSRLTKIGANTAVHITKYVTKLLQAALVLRQNPGSTHTHTHPPPSNTHILSRPQNSRTYAQAPFACIFLSACSVLTNRKIPVLSQPSFPSSSRLALSVKWTHATAHHCCSDTWFWSKTYHFLAISN